MNKLLNRKELFTMMGDRLQDLRKDRKISQQQLAEQLNISVHTVSSYERSRSSPDDEILIRIAKFFDISIDYLMGLIDKKCSYNRESVIELSASLSKEDLAKIQEYVDMVALTSNIVLKVHKKPKVVL